jgi:hypothetical protein
MFIEYSLSQKKCDPGEVEYCWLLIVSIHIRPLRGQIENLIISFIDSAIISKTITNILPPSGFITADGATKHYPFGGSKPQTGYILQQTKTQTRRVCMFIEYSLSQKRCDPGGVEYCCLLIVSILIQPLRGQIENLIISFIDSAIFSKTIIILFCHHPGLKPPIGQQYTTRLVVQNPKRVKFCNKQNPNPEGLHVFRKLVLLKKCDHGGVEYCCLLIVSIQIQPL